MWNKCIQIFVFCMVLTVSAQEVADSEKPYISWKAVPEIEHYQLQVRDNQKEIIIDKKLKATKYSLDLEPGNYEHRIGVYNKFGKVKKYTDWIPFLLEKSFIPEVTSEKKNFGLKTDKKNVLIIHGLHFLPETKVSLKNSLNEFPIISIDRPSKNTFHLILNNKDATIGEYDLILENPNKKILRLEKFYTLNEKEQIADNAKIIKEPDTKETKEAKEIKKPDKEEIMQPYPYWKEGGMSMLLPGWGQYAKGEKYKTILWDSFLLVSAGYLKSSLDHFNADKKKYNDSIHQLMILSEINGFQQSVGISYTLNEKYFLQAQQSSNRVYTVSIFLGVVYLANVLDALFWRIPVKTTQSSEKGLHIYANFYNSPSTLNTPQSSRWELGFRIKY